MDRLKLTCVDDGQDELIVQQDIDPKRLQVALITNYPCGLDGGKIKPDTGVVFLSKDQAIELLDKLEEFIDG